MAVSGSDYQEPQEPPLEADERQYLLQYLHSRRDHEELRTLVFELGYDKDSIQGNTKEVYAREMLIFFANRHSVRFLLEAAARERLDAKVDAIKNRLSTPPRTLNDYSQLTLPNLVRNRDKTQKDLAYYRDQLEFYKQSDSIPEIEASSQMLTENQLKLAALEQEIARRSSPATTVSISSPQPVASSSHQFHEPQQQSELTLHYAALLGPLLDGKVIPILGPEVNAFDRPPGSSIWQRSSPYPPTASELAQYLAHTYGYPYPSIDSGPALARISQYISVMKKDGPLQADLRSLFKTRYEPTPLHHFFATLPALLHTRRPDGQYPIFITAGYDDLLEQAFDKARQPYDLLFYVTTGNNSRYPKLAHWVWSPDKTKYIIIKDFNKYRFELEKRPLILKMHRVFDAADFEQSRRIVTEDQFINYMYAADAEIPKTLLAQLKGGGLLFLGYNVSDWSLRVMLHRIWGDQWRSSEYNSWAVEPTLQEVERNGWKKWDVEAVESGLKDYVSGLQAYLRDIVGPADEEQLNDE